MMRVYMIHKYYGLIDEPRVVACVSTKEEMEKIISDIKQKEPGIGIGYRVWGIKTLFPGYHEYLVSCVDGVWQAEEIYDIPLTLCPQIKLPNKEGVLIYEKGQAEAIEAAKSKLKC